MTWTPSPDSFFTGIDPARIAERAAAFEDLDLSVLSPEEVYAELMFVISNAPKRGHNGSVTLPTDTRTLGIGTNLFRGRLLDPLDHILPLRGMRTIEDAWEPPADKVSSPGRLNKAGEALLYTCWQQPDAVPYEIRAAHGAKFCLVRYRVVQPIRVTAIGLPLDLDHLSLSSRKAAAAINDFFARQFLRRVKLNDQGHYQLSELIAKFNYDLPPEVHHGWMYPSVERLGALNVTLRPQEAHRHLVLVGICVCRFSDVKDDVKFEGLAYTDGSLDAHGFIWSMQGSPLQERLFPEFR